MNKIGSNISSLRAKHGLTQQDLANRLHVSRSLIAMWEAGTRTPNYLNIAATARILGVDVSELADVDPGSDRPDSEASLINNEIDEMLSSLNLQMSKEELTTAVKAFLSRQSAKDNEIFMNRYLLGRSYKEIAYDLKISKSAVSVKLTRLRKKFRQFIKEAGK